MGWTLLTNPPKKSGRYIVAHRGHAEVIHFLSPTGGPWAEGTRLGWQKDPRRFGATHYMKLPRISDEQSQEADTDLKTRGLTRVVDDRTRYRPAYVPTKWDLFLALLGFQSLPRYPAKSISLSQTKPEDDTDPRFMRYHGYGFDENGIPIGPGGQRLDGIKS